MDKDALELNIHFFNYYSLISFFFFFLTFQLAQGVQRLHAIAMATVTMATLAQESATATVASTGLRVSCACQADMAPAAGVCLCFISILLPTSNLNHFVYDVVLSNKKKCFLLSTLAFLLNISSCRGMMQGLRREEKAVRIEVFLVFCAELLLLHGI